VIDDDNIFDVLEAFFHCNISITKTHYHGKLSRAMSTINAGCDKWNRIGWGCHMIITNLSMKMANRVWCFYETLRPDNADIEKMNEKMKNRQTIITTDFSKF
jgi:hypothetical protein